MNPSDLIAIGAIIVSLLSVYFGRRTAGTYEDLQKEIARQDQKIAHLENQREARIARLSALETQVLQLKAENEQMRAELADMRGREQRMLRGVQVLVKQIKSAGLQPEWEPNGELK